MYQAVVDSASVSSVLATILNTHKQIELKHGSFQFVERRSLIVLEVSNM